MNLLAETIGWIASIFVLFMFVPQLVKMLKLKTGLGVSLGTWTLNIALSLAWLVFGIKESIAQTIVLNILLVPLIVAVLYITLKENHSPKKYFPLILAGLTALTIAMFTLPAQTIGILCIILCVSADLPQVLKSVKSYRTHATTAVSLSTWNLAIIGGMLWLFYGLLTGTTAIAVANLFTLGTRSFIITCETLNKRRATLPITETVVVKTSVLQPQES